MAETGVICVEVAGSAYGIPVAEVQEVMGYKAPTRVFHAPSALAGITSLRGEVLPIIDLAGLLDGVGEERPLAADPRVVVVREVGGGRRRAGLKVDGLLGLREAKPGARTEVPAAVAARLGDIVIGVISEPSPAFALLSVSGILDSPVLRQWSGAALE
ncbi:MAG TPA: chemotaxis protein CheW [Polyangiaceae bacterium]|nr:chemotaxis protein CheW [Polyangiaceae bacterium]